MQRVGDVGVNCRLNLLLEEVGRAGGTETGGMSMWSVRRRKSLSVAGVLMGMKRLMRRDSRAAATAGGGVFFVRSATASNIQLPIDRGRNVDGAKL